MDQRPTLKQILQDLLQGEQQVYMQPPSSISMTYPCILAERSDVDTKFANNYPYLKTKRYQVTVIDGTPDSPISELVSGLPMCTLSQHFVADSLHHDVFTLYY